MIFFNVNASSICVKEDTFSNISQNVASKLRITFLSTSGKSVFFNKNSIRNLIQMPTSIVQIYSLKNHDFIIENVNNFVFKINIKIMK
jgi:hypothetical protein